MMSPPHLGETQGMTEELMPSPQVAQMVSPIDGDTVVMTQSNLNGFLRIMAGPALANLAIEHPADGVSQNSQIRTVYSDRDIAAVTWPGSSASNLPSSFATGDSCTTQRLEPGLWQRRY